MPDTKISQLPLVNLLNGASLIPIVHEGVTSAVTAETLAAYVASYVPPTPDYVVTTDAEWDAVFANSSATLANKLVEVSGSNFTQREIANHDFTLAGGPITIQAANASSSIPSIIFNGTVRGVKFSGMNFQMTGWPHTYGSCVVFNNGTFDQIEFINGTLFRHGYGPSQLDIDTTFEYPEYERVDNVQTATTTSATYALTWKDATANDGWIEFFNRGGQDVYVAVGGAGVTATAGDTLAPAGQKVRVSSLNPTVDTHFAILAAASTSEVNARTEIGLAHYLAPAFTVSGAATVQSFSCIGAVFRDLASGVKGGWYPQTMIVMDCDFRRIYMDVISGGIGNGGSLYAVRNLMCLPFSRAGIAENLNGDARDPHGDGFQMFGSGVYTYRNVYYAGNRTRMDPLRAGITQQGFFLSDNDFTPSYENIFYVSNTEPGGAGQSCTVGEIGFPADSALIYGATVVNAQDSSDMTARISPYVNTGANLYVGYSVAPVYLEGIGTYPKDNCLALPDAVSVPAVFPNLGNFPAANTRAEIEAALATAAEGAGMGAVATSNAIDWNTTDHTAVILWENVPSGAQWFDVEQLTPGTTYTSPLKQILNRRAAQTVVPGTGVEWRSVDTDKLTEVQAWTSASGTIEPDQFIQFRRAVSTEGVTTVTAGLTINGFLQETTLTTSLAPPSQYLTSDAIEGYFRSPANVAAGTTRITFRGKFWLPLGSINASMRDARLFAQLSLGCDLSITDTQNAFRVAVEDGDNTTVVNTTEYRATGVLQEETWLDCELDVDLIAPFARFKVNGVTYDVPFTAAISPAYFQTNRALSFLNSSVGGFNRLPAGTRIADLSVDINGVLHKTISSDPAVANLDSWKVGGDFI